MTAQKMNSPDSIPSKRRDRKFKIITSARKYVTIMVNFLPFPIIPISSL
jgi:hypothetical protein